MNRELTKLLIVAETARRARMREEQYRRLLVIQGVVLTRKRLTMCRRRAWRDIESWADENLRRAA
ncbi:MAG: hypothetical protein IMZ62_12990 [Chloroflexi bacterium]|nr:hypothetical protein [Chloroflexota bacterium]MBE3118194.1 hypothetical protein [Candidatus Atribacteria bacterium]